MLTIGSLARRTGVKVPTLRYYESLGLVAPAGRSDANQRRYDARAVDRLAFVRHARELGFRLDAIRALLALADRPEQPCDAIDGIARAQLGAVESRIERLVALRDELRQMVERCAGGRVAECRVIEALSGHGLCRTEHGGADDRVGRTA